MLSSSTLSLLASLQQKSHAAYSEGGLLYTYTEAANQAHFRLPAVSYTNAMQPSQIRELGRFLQASQGQYQADIVSSSYMALAEQLVEQLRADLKFDEIAWSLEEGGYDMTGTLKMARRVENLFFSLELWWSID
jgi:hypothetical protein